MSTSLDGWISIGAIVPDSYDTRESDLKPVLYTGGTFVDGFRVRASIVPLMMTFLVNGFGAWSLGEVQFLPNNAIETTMWYR
jgi:hypothetical protein